MAAPAKAMLSLQLAVGVAAGRGWIGRAVSGGRVIYMSAEDDDDELHRRLDDILQADGRIYDDLHGLTLRSLAGEDALLAVDSQMALMQSELFKELDARAADETPTLVVFGTLADVYPANEYDRAKVRQFIGILLGLALKRNCAVLLLGHPVSYRFVQRNGFLWIYGLEQLGSVASLSIPDHRQRL